MKMIENRILNENFLPMTQVASLIVTGDLKVSEGIVYTHVTHRHTNNRHTDWPMINLDKESHTFLSFFLKKDPLSTQFHKKTKHSHLPSRA